MVSRREDFVSVSRLVQVSISRSTSGWVSVRSTEKFASGSSTTDLTMKPTSVSERAAPFSWQR
jgi:hypothetical protein